MNPNILFPVLIAIFILGISQFAFADKTLVECIPLDKTNLLTQSGSVETINGTDRLVIRVVCITEFQYLYKFPDIPRNVTIPVTNPITNETEDVVIPVPVDSFIPKPDPKPNPDFPLKDDPPNVSEIFDEDELALIHKCARGEHEWKPIQERKSFEKLQDYIQNIRHYKGQDRELALNLKWQECHWANLYRDHLGPQYLGFIIDDFPEQLEAKHRQVDPRTSGVIYPVTTAEHIAMEALKAEEKLCSASWTIGICEPRHEKIIKDTKGYINPFSEVGTKLNEYLRQDLKVSKEVEERKALDVVCSQAWDTIAKGKSLTQFVPQVILDGSCGEWIAKWKEVNEPQACTMEYAPVCGIDGKTYPNQCHADVAKTPTAYKGECKNTAARVPIDKISNYTITLEENLAVNDTVKTK